MSGKNFTAVGGLLYSGEPGKVTPWPGLELDENYPFFGMGCQGAGQNVGTLPMWRDVIRDSGLVVVSTVGALTTIANALDGLPMIPANALYLGSSIFEGVVIGTSVSCQLGDGTTVNRYGTVTLPGAALGAVVDPSVLGTSGGAWNPAAPAQANSAWQNVAHGLAVTFNATPTGAGTLRVYLAFRVFTPPIG